MGRNPLNQNKSSLILFKKIFNHIFNLSIFNLQLLMIISFYIIHFTLYINLHCQTQVKLMPAKNLFPLIASNYFEPRVGLEYYPETGYFKVDAGKTVDLIQININNNYFSFGGEFLMQALGLNIKEKRLPIDAADGYFGINVNYFDALRNIKGRLRILHNSAHFVDGHQERNISYQPKENFVNDFFELTVLKTLTLQNDNINLYSGGGYPIVIHPKELQKPNLFLGFEYSYFLSNKSLNNRSDLFFAYTFNVSANSKYIGNNHLMFGLKLGDDKSNTFRIYISYYNGQNLFKQYYGLRSKEFSFGFLF